MVHMLRSNYTGCACYRFHIIMTTWFRKLSCLSTLTNLLHNCYECYAIIMKAIITHVQQSLSCEVCIYAIIRHGYAVTNVMHVLLLLHMLRLRNYYLRYTCYAYYSFWIYYPIITQWQQFNVYPQLLRAFELLPMILNTVCNHFVLHVLHRETQRILSCGRFSYCWKKPLTGRGSKQ